MNLILLRADELDGDRQVTLTDRRFVHIRDVLRASVGDRLRVGVLDGERLNAEIVSWSHDACVLRLGEAFEPLPEPRIDLLLALPRPKCLRRLWPQIAAMGVARIFIVNAERVERNYWGSRFLDPEAYQPLVEEGLEQAGDTRMPEIRILRRLKPLVEDELATGYADGCKLVAHPRRGEDGDKGDKGLINFSGAGRVLVAVGPEGGWSDYELRLFEANGFQRFGLGARTLRTDTACIALLAIVESKLSFTPSLVEDRCSGAAIGDRGRFRPQRGQPQGRSCEL